ncbi:MAG: hypothetical protein ACKOD2_02580 [Ilumatobacteraceae bacterium]
MKTVRYPLVVALAVLASVTAVNGAPSAAATWTPVPIPSGTQAFVGPCTGDTDLDCVESIGAVISGAEVKGTLTGRTGPSHTGGTCCHEWRIPGLVNEDGLDLVETQLKLTGDNMSSTATPPCATKCLVGFQGDIYATSLNGFRPQWESKLDTCAANNGRVNGICSRYGNLQQGVTFFMVLRTSWTLPSIVSAKSSEPVVTVEKLSTSGASRVRVQGIPHRIMGIDPPQMTTFYSAPDGRGAWASRSFAFHVLDGRQFPYYTTCSEKSALVMGDNTKGATPPSFDRTTGALDLKTVNPHFDTDGTTVTTGAYQARIPLETAQCLWGSKITSTKQFKVSVIEDSTGASKVSTTSITSDSNTFRIDASGVTFSSPTIRVVADEKIEATPETTAPATAPTVAVPAKPTGVKVTVSKGMVSVSFTRVSSVSYVVSAVRGGSTKKLTCRTATAKMTCTVRGLSKGSWKVSVTPRNSAGAGTAFTRTVRIP